MYVHKFEATRRLSDDETFTDQWLFGLVGKVYQQRPQTMRNQEPAVSV